ncbi:hypothetical protein FE257_010679 [Aspergillus nanangensis]|uniref:Thioesterase domain-containing protein n=1 Tax=Aspergillus nanangensis TaxID=2582783 RepID=A0AAD4CJI9_ASPNN|nr:hypothetical protein FE257_010679 [Aspergillus nanangensis]
MDSDSLEYFRTIPQCADIINRPGMKIGPSIPPRSHANPFVNQTLNQPDGLKHQLFLFRNEIDPQGALDREGFAFLALGHGVTGQGDVAHGGFLSAMMDHVFGSFIRLTNLDQGLGMFTGALNLLYHAPVFVPAVIIFSVKVARIERRKIYLDASIVDMRGDTCTTAEAIFVQKRPEGL